jgi:hypothetical protein
MKKTQLPKINVACLLHCSPSCQNGETAGTGNQAKHQLLTNWMLMKIQQHCHQPNR